MPYSFELTEAIERCEADTSVRMVVMTGAGTIFSVGGDLNGMKETAEVARLEEPELLAAAQAPARNLLACTKPRVAVMRGAAAGDRLALALAFDLRIAAAGGKFVFAYGSVRLAGDLGAA
ncbi:enoyl-CoA hydratase/isomerase family protein [Sphingomonas immobilis]|uniref:Enoyl-CoA hydratase/isomerase family protein n=1 Tax=Sphingomonas immobilis TaxID=3063997 RepID=A0ABT9A4M9_9SPHN|nr:enoyl-CoA hydratase/isomerase family protein [Sphingomonas sp. CA1-15]MDO7843921.1 enoyl-CoA hydratase/isomerase family protein [Sphingomonas sp. CA1-15]